MELFFDTETSDKFDFKNPNITGKNFPWVVQLGAILAEDGIAYAEYNVIIRPDGRTIEPGAQKVHNIPVELADNVGISEGIVAQTFLELVDNADVIIAHNMNFDFQIMLGMMHRCEESDKILQAAEKYCTMLGTTDLCKLPGRFGNYKWPKLQELHKFLFGKFFVGAHDAMFDIKATMKCFYELKKRGWIK